MEQKNDWVNQYLTPKQQAAMAELSRTSYSESAQAKVAAWGANWTEADQQRVNVPHAQRPPLPWGAAEQALLEEAVALQKK